VQSFSVRTIICVWQKWTCVDERTLFPSNEAPGHGADHPNQLEYQCPQPKQPWIKHQLFDDRLLPLATGMRTSFGNCARQAEHSSTNLK
jgi:hypothetical protein